MEPAFRRTVFCVYTGGVPALFLLLTLVLQSTSCVRKSSAYLETNHPRAGWISAMLLQMVTPPGPGTAGNATTRARRVSAMRFRTATGGTEEMVNRSNPPTCHLLSRAVAGAAARVGRTVGLIFTDSSTLMKGGLCCV